MNAWGESHAKTPGEKAEKKSWTRGTDAFKDKAVKKNPASP